MFGRVSGCCQGGMSVTQSVRGWAHSKAWAHSTVAPYPEPKVPNRMKYDRVDNPRAWRDVIIKRADIIIAMCRYYIMSYAHSARSEHPARRVIGLRLKYGEIKNG